MKKLIIFYITLFFFIFSVAPSTTLADTNMVPLRNVFESIGSNVKENRNTVSIKRGESSISLTKDSKIAIKNGKKIFLHHPIRYSSNGYVIHVLDVYKLAKNEDKEKHYRVRKGDTLSQIAKDFGVSVKELKQWNHLHTDQLYIHQHLHTVNPFYIVKAGDSLWEIANKNEIGVGELKNANHLSVDFIKPGQKLYIPTQPSTSPPSMLVDGTFPLLKNTYKPYGNDFDSTRSSSNNTAKTHEGIDIISPAWVPVFAIYEGKVIKQGYSKEHGGYLQIKAPNGVVFHYGNLNGFPEGLKKEQWVSKRQLIGYVGHSQNKEDLSHLHLSMYDSNFTPSKALNPFWYLKWWEMQ